LPGTPAIELSLEYLLTRPEIRRLLRHGCRIFLD
jgi:hypothetical protein